MSVNTKNIQQLYVAYFGRPADVLGLAYWENVVAAANGNIQAVSSSFAASAEYKATFAGLNTMQIVNAVYNNLFHRTAEVGGLLYWSNLLDQGAITIDNVVTQIANGAQTTDKIALADKVDAAVNFTNAMDTTSEILSYNGTPALAIAKSWLAGIYDATSEATALASLDTTIASLATAATPQTFTLTTGVDAIAPTTGHSTINAVDSTVTTSNGIVAYSTWSALDTIKAAGVDNVFNITTVNAVSNPAGAIVTGVQTMNVTQADATGDYDTVTLNTTTFTGLTALNVKQLGGETVTLTAAATTNVTETSAGTGLVTVTGGLTDTITTKGAVTVIGGVNIVVNDAGTTSIGTTAAPVTGTVSVVNSDAGTSSAVGSAITVVGGTTQTVSGSGNITLSKATGAVSVTETSGVTGTGHTGPVINVQGGTTVYIGAAGATVDTVTDVFGALIVPATAGTVTVGAAPTFTNAVSATPTTFTSTAPTGDVEINNSSNALASLTAKAQNTYYGNDVSTVYVNGATSVDITGGTVSAQTIGTYTTGQYSSNTGGIVDIQTDKLAASTADANGAAGTSTLSSVTLNGVSGAVGIASNALTNLTITDSTSVTTFGNSAVTAVTVTDAVAHALNLTLANTASETAVTDATATSIVVGTGAATLDGAATSNIAITAAAATSETFNNAAALTVTGNTAALVKTITANNAGTLDLGSVASTVTTVNGAGSTGAITATIGATTTSFAGGSGNDVVTIAALPTKAIAGGTGTNTLVWNASAPSNSALFLNSNITGFTTLGLGSSAAGIFDAAGFTALTAGTVAGDIAFTDLAAGTSLAVTASPNHTVTYTLQNNTANDSLALSLSTAATDGGFSAAITPTSIENLTIHSLGSAVTATNVNLATIVDTAIKSLVVDGAEGLTLTIAGPTALTSVDTHTATGTINLSSVVTSTAGATFTTGSGTTTIAGVAGLGNTDTIVGGTGAVVFAETGVGSISATLGDGGVSATHQSVTDTTTNTSAHTVTAGNGFNDINLSGTSGIATVTLGNGTNSVTTGSGADVIHVGTGSNTITAGAGADTIVFGIHAATVHDSVVQSTTGASGANTATSATTSVSTAAFDIITGLQAGDNLVLNTNTSHVATATNLAGSDGYAEFAEGTYNATAHTFTYSATGVDTLLTYAGAASTTYESVVLVGLVTGTNTISSHTVTLVHA